MKMFPPQVIPTLIYYLFTYTYTPEIMRYVNKILYSLALRRRRYAQVVCLLRPVIILPVYKKNLPSTLLV